MASFDRKDPDVAWCPGCGNYSIKKLLAEAFEELGMEPERTVMVSGIGQAAKMPQYLRCHHFNGLHGRALPAATAIKAVNPGLTVIAEGGDGDMYGEGGNHLLHAIRRNPDITLLVHENMVYGLTKGQAAPTTRIGTRTPVQVEGVFEKPLNPIALGVAMDLPFVARVFNGEPELLKRVVKEALAFPGFALVDIFHVCVSFNKVNTFKWFKENTYVLGPEHDPTDRLAAFARSIEEEPFPLGVIYRNDKRPTFESSQRIYRGDARALVERAPDFGRIEGFIADRKI
jgi:2-oxoglutarate/2-oxoacid ferredoxin oxidoreductase subunit beta